MSGKKQLNRGKVVVSVTVGNGTHERRHSFKVAKSKLPSTFGVEGLLVTVDQEKRKAKATPKKAAPRNPRRLKSMEVELPPARRADKPTWQKYGVLNIPKALRTFFPPYGVDFTLKTPRGEFTVKMKSAGVNETDRYRGGYISSATDFFRAHSDLRVGDTLVFTKVSKGREAPVYKVHVKTG